MCLNRLLAGNRTTLSGTLCCTKITRKIIKSVTARLLYAFSSLAFVWNVAVMKNNSLYWLLLLFLCPLGLETIYMVFRKGNEMKWMTPSVVIYLLICIPSMWLMEHHLYEDHRNKTASQNNGDKSVYNLNDDWRLALIQGMVFMVVFGRWIVPKGEVSRNELSQLLLVYLAAGADIIDFVGYAHGDEVKSKTGKTFFNILLIAWSWSMLQFCFVSTASKNLPPLDDQDEELITSEGIKESAKSDTLTTDSEVISKKHKDSLKTPIVHNGKQTDVFDDVRIEPASMMKEDKTETDETTDGQSLRVREEVAGIENKQLSIIEEPTIFETQNDFKTLDESHVTDSNATDARKEDGLKADKMFDKVVRSSKRCEFFCFYNEIWGMVLGIIFQDGPFFIFRVFIMSYYKVVTNSILFFTFKNALVILLLLHRIRLIVQEEHKPWKNHMDKVKLQRFREKNEKRQQRGLPPKKPKPPKSRDEGQQDGKMRNKQND